MIKSYATGNGMRLLILATDDGYVVISVSRSNDEESDDELNDTVDSSSYCKKGYKIPRVTVHCRNKDGICAMTSIAVIGLYIAYALPIFFGRRSDTKEQMHDNLQEDHTSRDERSSTQKSKLMKIQSCAKKDYDGIYNRLRSNTW
ncbi:hypothetical protein L1987_46768 [Smallanthus sonchifolius]|uniref:Uncharacterized protein n=1 Tax=Smallanthus sonchifolius TaxID=185202 RepID=A0ACB9G1N3_9ASTR|nr:hypothetical protein L1987_46768 [Smallanthus sonchifolius]